MENRYRVTYRVTELIDDISINKKSKYKNRKFEKEEIKNFINKLIKCPEEVQDIELDVYLNIVNNKPENLYGRRSYDVWSVDIDIIFNGYENELFYIPFDVFNSLVLMGIFKFINSDGVNIEFENESNLYSFLTDLFNKISTFISWPLNSNSLVSTIHGEFKIDDKQDLNVLVNEIDLILTTNL